MRAVEILFDTLSRRFLSNYGNAWIHTPNFERLKEHTIKFDNFYAGSFPCMPARRDLQTGRYNFLHRMWGPLEAFDNSVIEKLKQNDVYCHLITDHSHYWEDGGATYHTRFSSWEGFRGQEGDRWVPRINQKIPENYSTKNKMSVSVSQNFANRTRMPEEKDLSSVKVMKAGIKFLEKYHKNQNWYLQIESFDPHEPFYVPDRYRKLYLNVDKIENPYFWPKYGKVSPDITEEDMKELRKEYASLITMCDYYLGKIIDIFDKYNMWDDTLIIINTDHGFLLGEHDWLGKNIMPLYDELVHLPFFINLPGVKVNQSILEIAQNIDVPATLLDYFKIKNDLDMDGKSLLPILVKHNINHKYAIFGIYGGHVNITDGRYVYMRASANPDNAPQTIETLSTTLMRDFIKKDDLKTIKLCMGNRFTNGVPYNEITVQPSIDTYKDGNLLFDLKHDPKQKHPIRDEQIEKRMIRHLIEIMKKVDAPDSLYERLGLTKN